MPNPKRNIRKARPGAMFSWKHKRSGKIVTEHYLTLSDIEDSKYSANVWFELGLRAGFNAVNENKAMNIAFTVVENGWIVKKTADGNVEKISPIEHEVSNREKPLTKGTILHVKGNQ
jgi:hypothetical protein